MEGVENLVFLMSNFRTAEYEELDEVQISLEILSFPE